MENRFGYNSGPCWVNPAPNAAPAPMTTGFSYITSIGCGGTTFTETTNFQKIGQFQEIFSSPKYDPNKPAKMPSTERLKLRRKLNSEEFLELEEALDSGDLPHIAKEIADLLYVLYGLAHEYNIDADACLTEVHRSNLSKLDEYNKPIYRDDGKVLKSKLFSPADTSFVLNSKQNPLKE